MGGKGSKLPGLMAAVLALLCAALAPASVASADGQAGRAELMKCRPDWMWEPDAYMRNKPRCKDLDKKNSGDTRSGDTHNEGDGPDQQAEDGTTPPKVPGYEKYSCWTAPAWCVQSTGNWGTSQMDQQYQRYYTYHKNVCAHRVVVRACIGRVGKAPACSMSGIEPGKTWQFDMSRSNGQYRVMHAGVMEGKDDLICPKPPAWKPLHKF